jgi:glycosyltransferase involved in cell wall biosynthesis
MHTSSSVRALLGRKIDRVMRYSALVIAGNEYLTERAKKVGAKRVEYLPSVVDVRRYALKQHYTDSPFRIGWIGSPVTAPYLDIIRTALNILSLEANIHIVLIGAGSINPFPELPTTMLDWDENQELSIGYDFDVGVMPLVDGPFERGKCGYKLVQYMAAGLPIIASPVGVNSQIVTPGVNGYLADSTDGWVESLRRLINNTELRFKMGQAGRHKAEQMYNLQITAAKLLDLLSSARKV